MMENDGKCMENDGKCMENDGNSLTHRFFFSIIGCVKNSKPKAKKKDAIKNGDCMGYNEDV